MIRPLVNVSLVFLVACCGADELQPGEEFPGGDTTNTLLFGTNALTFPAENISAVNEPLFYAGNGFFNQPWVTAPASTAARDGLGPLFNARSCAACHFKDGRGRPPLSPEEDFLGLLLRLSIPGETQNGGARPDPTYGGQLQPFSVQGVPAEGRPTVRFEEQPGTYADGTAYTLLMPRYEVRDLAHGPFADGIMMSPRVAPAMVGLGLLEAIPEERLRALSDPDDANGDGISGRINQVWDAAAEKPAVGRFGWKAEQPTVRQQSAGAFLGDIGITTTLFPSETCTSAQPDCAQAQSGGVPELADDLLHRVDVYGRLLAVPVRQSYDSDEVLQGKALFSDLGCAACHTPQHETGVSDLSELSHQRIWPYTDLLLHDMGEGLADNRPSFSASGREWRTPPLWGNRFYEVVNGHDRLLHDGRARGVAEAILWHGGEGQAARDGFLALSESERDAVVAFVRSL